MDDSAPARDATSVDAEIAALWVNSIQHAGRIRRLEKLSDTHLETGWQKRLLFCLDGWPLHGLAVKPQWRPWRRFWTS